MFLGENGEFCDFYFIGTFNFKLPILQLAANCRLHILIIMLKSNALLADTLTARRWWIINFGILSNRLKNTGEYWKSKCNNGWDSSSCRFA